MELQPYTARQTRYDTMAYARSGKSGLVLPRVSLGLWHNFGSCDSFDNMRAMLREAFDAGILHFDLANNYGPEPGSAEENLGRLLRQDFAPYRDELILSTKAGYRMWPGPYGDFGSRKYLLASLDASLKRMGLDYMDIFYHHRMDPDTPLEETMGALASAVRQGKAIYAGLSNYDGPTMLRAAKILEELHCPYVLNQNRYSIFDRTIEQNGLKKAAAQAGRGIIAFSPLAQGLLTEKYLHGVPEGSRMSKTEARGKGFLPKERLTPERLAQIEALHEIATGRGQTLAQLALCWVLKDSDVTSVLIGASSAAQIRENAAIVNAAKLTSEELAAIDKVSGFTEA